ncbi:Membrane protein insertase YidC [bioreactor metagenome]|uniref:Membrane protein insertase YidC n=1 Tax=bioreactor metagenome TaxID=1076179 RepID=A0A645ISG4_9ZZZZ
MSKNPTMGCMTFGMPLMSVYFGFLFPAGIGVYWIVQNLLSTLQIAVLNRTHSNEKVIAKEMVVETIKRRSKEENTKFIANNK